MLRKLNEFIMCAYVADMPAGIVSAASSAIPMKAVRRPLFTSTVDKG